MPHQFTSGHIPDAGRPVAAGGHPFMGGPAAGERRDVGRMRLRCRRDRHRARARGAADGAGVSLAAFTAKVAELPKREHLEFPVDEQLVVELMSR